MATPRKETDKTVSAAFSLPLGIKAEPRKDGTVGYIVTVRSGAERRQYRFDDLTVAKEYKALDRRRKAAGQRALTKDEFLAQDGSPTASPDALTTIKCDAMLDQLGDVLAEDAKKPGSVTTPLNVLRHYFDVKGVLGKNAESVDGRLALELPGWLNGENYGKGHQRAVLRIAERLFAEALRCGHVSSNPFTGLKVSRKQLPQHDRRGNDRMIPKAAAWTPEQLVAISFLLRPCYLLAYWLIVVLGLRRSEITGLTIGSWDSEERWLWVIWQRTGSPAQGRTTPKTLASTRPLPVPVFLAAMIDTYIRNVHGSAPTDPAEMLEWKDRYLITGVQGGPMDGASLCDAVQEACVKLNLTVETVGKFDPLHHIRGTISSLLQNPVVGVTGRAISDYLGHETAATIGKDPAARVTLRHYSPEVLGELRSIADYLDSWIPEILVPLVGSSNFLEVAPVSDGIVIEEAVRRLQEVDKEITLEDVMKMIEDGTIRGHRHNFTGPSSDHIVVVSADEVDEVLAKLLRSAATTYSAAEVAELLYTDHSGVYRLLDKGEIEEVTVNARARMARHGNRGGALPGGGRRFARVGVDALVEADAKRLHRLRHWLTVGETAELLGCSPDTVRRMGEADGLVMWRDPKSYRNERRIGPYSARRAQRALAAVSYAEAAKRLGCTVPRVRALVKVNALESGRTPKTITLMSIAQYEATTAPKAG